MTEPLILSTKEEDSLRFREMMEKTIDSIVSSSKKEGAFSGINPNTLREKIEALDFLPQEGIGFDRTLSKVEEEILPHLLRTWSPRYMPHLHAPALTETIASELLIASFNDSMDSWDQGPAATEVEEFVIHGLLELFDFGKSRGYGGASISEYGPDGTFTSGGSQSNISAIIAARDWYCQSSLNWDVKGKGLPPSYNKLRLYTSEISHFSMDKACHILGLGYDAVRKIPVDSLCKVDINAFEEMVASDVKEGLLPFCAVATLGTTDFGSIDNIEAMRVVCDKYGMHLHGDGAYGGALSMSSKYYNRLGKVSLLDSLTVDFHKMFLFPISCSVVLFKEGKKLDCFELHADYLNREEDEEEGYINLVGKSFQTTRRFDALKVLMAFQTRGKTGMASFIEKNLDTATYFYNCLHNDDAFIAPVKPELSSVVFALKGGDEVNKAVRKALLSQGTVIGQTVFDNKVMLKFTLLNPNIGKEQIDGIIEEIKVLGHCKH